MEIQKFLERIKKGLVSELEENEAKKTVNRFAFYGKKLASEELVEQLGLSEGYTKYLGLLCGHRELNVVLYSFQQAVRSYDEKPSLEFFLGDRKARERRKIQVMKVAEPYFSDLLEKERQDAIDTGLDQRILYQLTLAVSDLYAHHTFQDPRSMESDNSLKVSEWSSKWRGRIAEATSQLPSNP